MKTIKLAVLLFGLLISAVAHGFGQTNIQIFSVATTDEQAIRLTWTSISNEVYQIQCANELGTNTDTSTAWQLLYDEYPSQGTNTFWLDTGNYNLSPPTLHPKYMPMRFYRILDIGPDTTSDEPTVAITSPTNSATATNELTVTVQASTDQPFITGTKLYVDGQEMQAAFATTNYAIDSTNYEIDTYSLNTCEWGNETHTLFATVECQSGDPTQFQASFTGTGHAVSPFVPVTFNNLVTRISFSQCDFDPSLSETQEVSAVFAANSDWTLDIVDINSNVVQSASGSGTSMVYDWDGTGTGGTNLPNGIYFYYISASTNGLPGGAMMATSGESSLGLSAGMQSDVEELWAMPADGSADAVPFAMYPEGIDTNTLIIFEASQAEMDTPAPSLLSASSSSAMYGSSLPLVSSSPAPSPQTSPPAPQRPPNNPIKGSAGTLGVAYNTFTGNGTNGYSFNPLLDGSGAGTHIQFEGASGTAHIHYDPLTHLKGAVNTFIGQMQHWGWNNTLVEADDKLGISDLQGSGSPFNNVNMAFYEGHCVYGTTPDYAANQCKQMYFPITSASQYLRMSTMNWGGSTTNSLRWMALKGCFTLYHVNWSSMGSAGIKPYNNNLHLLLGMDGIVPVSSRFVWNWAQYMNYGTTNTFNPLTIRSAWYQAGKDAFRNQPFPSGTVITYAISGDTACQNDKLQSYSSPGGTRFYETQQVFP